MESGTESDVEDLQLLSAASSRQTTVNEKEAKKEVQYGYIFKRIRTRVSQVLDIV